MENISPTLLLLLDVRAALENGTSVRTGVLHFLKNHHNSLSDTVSSWLLRLDQGQETHSILQSLHPCRRTLLTLLEKGIAGMPILAHLIELENEVVRSCESELEEQIQKLPIKLMLPVLFLMFPAYLILLLGPILLSILSQF
jgi:hypothetical protein